jgi:hypothetical protein
MFVRSGLKKCINQRSLYNEYIQRQVKQAKLYDKPKDNDGSSITIGDCIENVIDQLEEELKHRIEEI